MSKIKKDKVLNIIRITLVIIVFIAIAFASIKVFQLVNRLTTDEAYKMQFGQQVKNNGILGVLMVIGLQIIQIFVAIIPGQPVEIMVGMLYGTWLGVIICTIGIFLGTVVVYYIVKKVGKGIMKLFFNKKDIDQTEEVSKIKDDKKITLLLFLIFLIPAIPKDIFIYFGPFIKLEPKKFILLATLPRIPGLFLTVHAGTKLTEGSYVMIAIVVLILIITGLVWYFVNKKKKVTN